MLISVVFLFPTSIVEGFLFLFLPHSRQHFLFFVLYGEMESKSFFIYIPLMAKDIYYDLCLDVAWKPYVVKCGLFIDD